jgi:type I restriction enzyme M protein
MPALRAALFAPADRPRYHQLRLAQAEVKAAILDHREFRAFTASAAAIFADWRARTRPKVATFAEGRHPNELIADIAEDLLDAFRAAPLIDAYDIYQHLMSWWNEVMQDDCYLISGTGWVPGARVTGRVKELAERYDTPLSKLEDHVAALAAKVAGHLKAMGLAA